MIDGDEPGHRPDPFPHPPSPIPRHLLGFVRLLRARGIGVSPAEAVDALRAIATVPDVLVARASFEAALAGTLVKRAADLPTFRELFAAYFVPESAHTRAHNHEHGHRHDDASIVGVDVAAEPEVDADSRAPRHEHGARVDLRRYFGDGGTADGHDHHGADRLRLTWLGREVRFDRAGMPPPVLTDLDGGFTLRRLQTAGAPGGLRADAGVELPRDVVLRGLGETWRTATDRAPDADLMAWVEEAIASGVIARHSTDSDEGRSTLASAATSDALPDLAWDALSNADLARLERAIARLGRKLGGAPGRHRPGRRGRLDVAATMRHAAATDGVPFRPVFRRRMPDRPRLVVLCDASLSVRGAARFLLHVCRAAQRQSGRVRTFAFVRDVAEVTHVLQRADLAAAIAAIYDGRLLDTAEASDAGAALAAFLARCGDALTPRTTVLILGDGRNNGRDPNLPALAELRSRCRRLIWLSPEARPSWRLGGCDLAAYAPACDILASVRTPADLERVMSDR